MHTSKRFNFILEMKLKRDGDEIIELGDSDEEQPVVGTSLTPMKPTTSNFIGKRPNTVNGMDHLVPHKRPSVGNQINGNLRLIK
jgi:hypothetical protein